VQHKHRSLKLRWVALLVGAFLVATGAMTGSPSPSLAAASGNWPQLGHDPHRANYTPAQVDPPCCYTWKWDEVPIASRAQPGADLHLSSQSASPPSVKIGQIVVYIITIRNQGGPLVETARLTDVLPSGLTYVPRSLKSSRGSVDASKAPALHWSGVISEMSNVTISYAATVAETKSHTIVNTATLDGGSAGRFSLSATVTINNDGFDIYLPVMIEKADPG
jgi:uncharacterized repeat protein (TIGR01451 family)